MAPTNSSSEIVNGWISCADELPPYRKDVLVYSGAVYIGYRHHTDEGGQWWRISPRQDKEWNDVTHWQLLPGGPNG